MTVEFVARDSRHDRDGTQQSRGVVDQKHEHNHAGQRQHSHDADQELRNRVGAGLDRDREEQHVREQADCPTDHIVAQQHGGNDARARVTTGDLDLATIIEPNVKTMNAVDEVMT